MNLVIYMNLGNRITKVRKEKKLTQQELAKKLFVTDKTISSWESNRTEPNLETIMKLSEVLDCSAGYLIYEDITRNDIETEIKRKNPQNKWKNLGNLSFFMYNYT